MKKLVVLLVAFMVLACGAFAVTAVFAEEITEPPATETLDTTPGTEGEEPVTPPEDQTTDAEEDSLKDKLNALLEKLKESESMDYFTTTILPLLVTAGSTILAVLALLLPFLKNHSRYKQLQGVYAELKTENEKLQELLKSTDVGQIKDGLAALLGDEVVKAVEAFKIDKQALSEVITQLQELHAMLKKLTEGAKVAWAESGAAVSCLCENTSQTVLERQNLLISALESYIVAQKGDEAQKILTDIKEEAGV